MFRAAVAAGCRTPKRYLQRLKQERLYMIIWGKPLYITLVFDQICKYGQNTPLLFVYFTGKFIFLPYYFIKPKKI